MPNLIEGRCRPSSMRLFSWYKAVSLRCASLFSVKCREMGYTEDMGSAVWFLCNLSTGYADFRIFACLCKDVLVQKLFFNLVMVMTW